MEQICKYEDCTGCMACYNACTHNAIVMMQDNEGFLRPKINQDQCVDCKLCYNKCPINKMVEFNLPLNVYSGWAKNINIRLQSSSGGAFSAIAIPILEHGGIVFGAVLDDKLQVKHVCIDDITKLSGLRGSKYVQSNIQLCYRDVKEYLIKKRTVLFSGTPCQIAGLKAYLSRDYENLFTIDLICHGVPSPGVFEEWKKWIKNKFELVDISSVKFRGKKYSWIYFNTEITGYTKNNKNFKYIGAYYKDEWIRGFLRDYFLRPSCYNCNFTKIERCSDFTIADWWGYKPDKDESWDFESKGVSLIMCNTQKAYNYFLKHCAESMTLKARSIEEALRTNKSLRSSFQAPSNRENFWSDYFQMPFSYVVKKYMKPENLPIHLMLRTHLKPSLTRNIICSFFYRIHKLFRF